MSSLLLRFAQHWIAGETAAEALARSKEANGRRIAGIINLLGEAVVDQREVLQSVDEYSNLLKQIREQSIDSAISIKPTQLGLSLQRDFYYENLRRLVVEARAARNFVWIDMEGSPYTQDTIDTYLKLSSSYENMGICIQAYLKRSEDDVRTIVSKGGKIRLCKGAYRESPAIAIKSRKEISANYAKLMTILFEKGDSFGIATHDQKLIDEAVELTASFKPRFEFQMLLGVRDTLKGELVARGYRVSEYIPYGRNWLSYSMRRLRERKRNILLLLRSLVSG